MYEYIIGKIAAIHPAYIVIETNGIGYQIASETLIVTVAK